MKAERIEIMRSCAKSIEKLCKEIINFSKDKKNIYIYGTGRTGIRCSKLLKFLDIPVCGFIVSHEKYKNSARGIDASTIYTIDEFQVESGDGVIVASVPKFLPEILPVLKEKTLSYMVYTDAKPILEITTKIGCSVNCKYCPQSKLVAAYQTKERDKILSFNSFKTYLDKIPPLVLIRFCGMSEPFLNPECGKMIRYAVEKGFDIDLYTTLVGVERNEFLSLLKILPEGSITLHLADAFQNCNIPVTKEYVSMVKSVFASPGRLCNCVSYHGELHPELEGIVPEGTVIWNEMQDRAGNLSEEEVNVYHQEKSGPVICTENYGYSAMLDCNILLPNGEVALCCMDYGLEYLLGNLNEESYLDIRTGENIRKIRKEMLADGDDTLICRRCNLAREIL